MTFNSKIINNILDNIFPIPENFGVLVSCSDGTEPINFNELKTAVFDADPSASIYFGMSKLVIASPNIGNVVIKIPFNGYWMETDCETGEIEWNPFEWAAGTDKSDYCLTEYEKYERLKTYDLNCFAAKIIYYKTICGVKVFLQEYVEPLAESCKSPNASNNSKNLAKKWKDEGKFYINQDWIANCLDKYGESKVGRFLYYCDNLDPDILEDVHSGNFGYRKDGSPCLIDYSNYGD